ncbi:hypothetical protein ACQ7DA_09680 [Zafaria sp. J156]|uniref:hypothetical protein n=1 Tax=Zafaria sp. J156 TaxID=3116490 RepID=UPI002E7909F4|nr:hypothetical protein [Zafaria sp. J156]MEE1621903.1 hypothetical protein [Zafaria sp. J156]
MSPAAAGPGRRLPGMRAALALYLVIVTAGFGAAGAQALWSFNSAVSAGVTAGAWAPNPVTGTVTCTRQDGGPITDRYADITVRWTATDAVSYTVTAVRKGSASVTISTTSTTSSATLRINRATLFDSQEYTATITATANGLQAAPRTFSLEMGTFLGIPTVGCS